ncbi:MAG: PQQ-binding-like beta-propeller repeat protein [Bacillota bacterium]
MNKLAAMIYLTLIVVSILSGGGQTRDQRGDAVSAMGGDRCIDKDMYLTVAQKVYEDQKRAIVIAAEEEKQLIIPADFDLSHMGYQVEPNIEGIRNVDQVFPKEYSDMEGVLSFRGNNFRDTASYGIADVQEKKLEILWAFKTGSRSWGGGAGWTGQPSIIKWPEEIRKIMNIQDEFKEKENFVEVVSPSLDGKIYFFALESGKQTRDPIDIKNPIKGSVALDPRGYPILYVGQGIPETGEIGYRIFSLIDGKLLFFIKGIDPFAYRGWGAFDGAPVINRNTDTLIMGGENGLFYNIKLNTALDIENKHIEMNPEVMKYRYKVKDNAYQGIENSVAVYKNFAYFADNGGSIQAVDLTTMKPVWVLEKIDDTDATITIEVEEDTPFVYTGTEVDKQGTKGNAHLRKIHGLTGETIWEKEYHCISLQGEKPVNAGLFATNIIGKHDIENMVVFTLARYNKFHGGLMLALDKKTGEEVWRWEMPNYAWSSPVSIYDSEGKSYIIQGDSTGTIFLLEGKTGEILSQINVGVNIESSPAVFNDILVIASRGGKIFGIKIK